MRAEIIQMPTTLSQWFLVRERDIQFRPEDMGLDKAFLLTVALREFQIQANDPNLTWEQALRGIPVIRTAEVPDHIVDFAVAKAQHRLTFLENLGMARARQGGDDAVRAAFRDLLERYPPGEYERQQSQESEYCKELQRILRQGGLH
jgi:hypothetical protein